jgi:hypothetical protein
MHPDSTFPGERQDFDEHALDLDAWKQDQDKLRREEERAHQRIDKALDSISPDSGEVEEHYGTGCPCGEAPHAPDCGAEKCTDCGGLGWAAVHTDRDPCIELQRCDYCAKYGDDDDALVAALIWIEEKLIEEWERGR